MKNTINKKTWLAVSLLAAFLLPLLFKNDDFLAGILFQTLLWAGLAGAWNLLGGYAGQFSLGHAAYFGIGAYTSTILANEFAISPWLGLLAGALLSGLIGLGLGAVCFRLKGHFFALATLAFGQIMHIIALSWRELTNGAEGMLLDVKTGWVYMAFNSKLSYVYLALVFTLIVLVFTFYLEKSPLGYNLMAYRENDEAARAIGVNTFRARVIASGISASLMSIGGTIFAQYIYYIDPDSVLAVTLSVQAPLIAIVGGLGQPWGPLFGSFLILPLTQMLRATMGHSLSGLHLIVYGVILIIVLLLIPEGIFPKLKQLAERSAARGVK